MRRRRVVVALCALGVALLIAAAPTMADEPASKHGRESTATESDKRPDATNSANAAHAAHAEDVEEVLVTGERVTGLRAEERRAIYRELARGRELYARADYERAFPHLLNTAEHGFKGAQARVGYIYLRGLGEVARDSAAAVGWLGVAASGNSAPEITNYFNGIWKQIPERHVPYFEEIVEEYESKYGEEATDVTCELRRPVDSHLKQLSCYFDKDMTGEEHKLLEEFVNNKMRDAYDQAIAEEAAIRTLQREVEP